MENTSLLEIYQPHPNKSNKMRKIVSWNAIYLCLGITRIGHTAFP